MPKGRGGLSGTKVHKWRGRMGHRGGRVTLPGRGPSARSQRGGGRREGDKLQGLVAQQSTMSTIASTAGLGDRRGRRGIAQGRRRNGRGRRLWGRRRSSWKLQMQRSLRCCWRSELDSRWSGDAPGTQGSSMGSNGSRWIRVCQLGRPRRRSRGRLVIHDDRNVPRRRTLRIRAAR